MNKEWSELNKTIQAQIKKKDTYEEGIGTLFDLRNRLMEVLISFKDELRRSDFDAIPFINAYVFFQRLRAEPGSQRLGKFLFKKSALFHFTFNVSRYFDVLFF